MQIYYFLLKTFHILVSKTADKDDFSIMNVLVSRGTGAMDGGMALVIRVPKGPKDALPCIDEWY